MTTATAGDVTNTSPVRRSRSRLRLRTALVGWSFILPNFIGFATLTLVPVVTLFYMSATNWAVFGHAQVTWFANYIRLFNDTSFQTALVNTLYYSALHIPLTFAISLGLALLFNSKLKGVGFFRTAAFFPYVTSIVAIAIVWSLLFSPDYGPINQVLRFIGIANPPGWLTSTGWALPATAIINIWRDMGYYMILFLAGLQTVPRELLEAARVDGANAVQRFFSVTLPCIRPTTFFVTVILTINSFKVFDLIIVLTQGGPGQATLVLSQFVYTQAFTNGQFGYSSSAAVVLFLICVVVTVIQYFVNRRRSDL